MWMLSSPRTSARLLLIWCSCCWSSVIDCCFFPFSLFLRPEPRRLRSLSLSRLEVRLNRVFTDSALTLNPDATTKKVIFKFRKKAQVICYLPILSVEHLSDPTLSILDEVLSFSNSCWAGDRNHSDLVLILAACLSCTWRRDNDKTQSFQSFIIILEAKMTVTLCFQHICWLLSVLPEWGDDLWCY
jgi:hypothetical protein